MLAEYRPFYEKLIVLSQRFIEKYCTFKGSFEKAKSRKKDPNFLNDYRYFTFTKSTKTLTAINDLLEIEKYEDTLVLCRTMLECYLSQRYFDDKYDENTLMDMVVIPTGVSDGVYINDNGIIRQRDNGENIPYNRRDPDDLTIGKDKTYFWHLYAFLCEITHCNFSTVGMYIDGENKFTIKNNENASFAHICALFVFSKLFESVVLLESTRFESEEEEGECVKLFTELTVFLYEKLYDFYQIKKTKTNLPKHNIYDTAKNMMNSLKEQLGRVDKGFVEALAKQNELTTLEKNLKPALLTMEKPSLFFEELRRNKRLGFQYPELEKLIGIQQSPIYHPEGDVWNHTMQAIDRAAKYRDRVSNPYAYMLLVLCHDLGKATCTTVDEKGNIHSLNHEIEGVKIAKKLLDRITNNDRVKQYVLRMIPYHMKPARYASDNSRIKATDELFGSVPSPFDIIFMSKADKDLPFESEEYLMARYQLYIDKHKE